jgi:phosphate transport system substrate-binding protein
LPVVLAVTLLACRQEPATPAPVPSSTPIPLLNIGLSSSAAPVADLVEAAYEAEAGGVQLNFIIANNATLFADLADGSLEAILVHYLPPDAEQWFNPVALDGLVLVVDPENPVTALTRPEVQAIFSGRLDGWSGVGGPEWPISLVGRERGAGVRLLFNQRVMVEQRLSINTEIQSDNEALLNAVAADPNAIGYTMLGAVEGREDVVPLELDGVAPTPNSVGTQNYPLTVPLYFVAPEEPAGSGTGGALRAFLAWLQGDEGQLILSENYGRVR